MIRVTITLPSSDYDLMASQIVELQILVNERHDPNRAVQIINQYVKIEKCEDDHNDKDY